VRKKFPWGRFALVSVLGGGWAMSYLAMKQSFQEGLTSTGGLFYGGTLIAAVFIWELL